MAYLKESKKLKNQKNKQKQKTNKKRKRKERRESREVNISTFKSHPVYVSSIPLICSHVGKRRRLRGRAEGQKSRGGVPRAVTITRLLSRLWL